MSELWVLDRLFKANVALFNWDDEAGTLGYEGPHQPASEDPAPLHVRWLLHPALGLPLSPFVLWRHRDPGGGLTPQEMADLPGWEPIERIGLPVDDSWTDTGYDLGEQGPKGKPLSPRDAAVQRVQLGAPRIGWTGLAASGETLPDWAPPDLDAYVEDVLAGALPAGVAQMLIDQPDPLKHAAYTVTDTDTAGAGRLSPHLLLQQDVIGARDQPAGAAWHPLGLLLLAAGSDPLASLVLGFGTATRQLGETSDIYMVSVRHRLVLGALDFTVQLADVVTLTDQPPAPAPPRGVAAQLAGHTRPQTLDGPAIDTVGVTWQRPSNPSFGHLPADTPRPVSYAIGRIDVGHGGGILLAPRPERVRGWQPFAPSKPDVEGPARFMDHLARATEVGGETVGQPLASDRLYAVAAQDLFGRWSRWSTVPYTDGEEPPQTPQIFSVSLEPTGEVTIDLGWDWSARSPELIELSGVFADDPGGTMLTKRLSFGGRAEPDNAHPPDLVPLSPDLAELSEFGGAQDRDPSAPEVRFYRVRANIGPVDFEPGSPRTFQVQARGQCHLHELLLPGTGVSPFGTPVATRVEDPTSPPAPGGIPEAPQWASLRDAAGVSRAVLRWAGVPGVVGYVLYEATETALLGALGLPGPDLSRPYTERLAVLRHADLPALRRVFRRVRPEVIATDSAEVELPRGSAVLHLYAVTAIGRNKVESAFPSQSMAFFAVAAPRAPAPVAPSLTVEVDAQAAQPTAHVRVSVGSSPVVSAVELFRIADEGLARSVDTMGPPVVTIVPVDGVATFDDKLVPSRQRTWYRAVAWTAADAQRGLLEARSLASNPVSVAGVYPPGRARRHAFLPIEET